MGNINFSSASVDATKTSVKTSFENLQKVINDMEAEKKKLSTFWSSTEADDFVTKLDNLSDMITKFNAKYEKYMSLLDQVYNAYKTDNTNFVAAINSLMNESA